MKPPIKKPGRQTKLTPELIVQFEGLLRSHVSHKAAYELLGIAKPTFYRWLQEGEAAASGLKRDFYDSIKRAQGVSTATLTKGISDDSSWQAKAWLLARMYPKQYGRPRAQRIIADDDELAAPVPAVKIVWRYSPGISPGTE
jgi:hypothetical protein